ncbi:MAG TPA: apolipoprotein acyltransferase, partial [Beijerinckia sp.]|nr:apolipoprotein acyltransferase [Beijerinckia sp.]
MASSNKAQDPAEAALLAIEEALNLAAADTEATRATEATLATAGKRTETTRADANRDKAVQDPAKRPRLPSVGENSLLGSGRAASAASQDSRTQEARTLETRTERPNRVTPSSQPANDDRHAVGEVLRAFQGRSSRTPTIIAALCSALWVILTLGYIFINREALLAEAPVSLLPQAAFYLLALGGPVIFFFITAIMARRAQEMRITARSMTEMAFRLAEPETIATEQMVTLSQAIRREVASMGDGIERALARAGELETLVRSEVSNLERSYSENERRVRSLIDELSSERESVLTNADRVRNTIAAAQETLARDLERASTGFNETVTATASRVSASLGLQGDEIRSALGRAGDDLLQQFSVRGNELLGRLTQTSQDTTTQLAQASDSMSNALGERIAELDSRFKTAGEVFAADLGMRGNDLAVRLDAKGAEIADTISSRGESLAARLAETGDRLHEVVTVEGNALHDKLAGMTERTATLITERASAARESIDLSTENFAAIFEESHARLQAQFEEHAGDLHQRFATTAEDTAAALSSHTQALHEHVAATIGETLDALTSHSDQLHAHLQVTAQDTLGA